jgi:hypothetical protein
MRRYGAALNGVKAQATGELGAARTISGSLNALCVSYYRSPDFKALRSSTQVMHRYIIEHFRNEYGDLPVNRLCRKHIKDIIGAKSDTPHAANNLLKMLRLLLKHAVSIDMIDAKPAIGVGKYKTSTHRL